MIEIKPLDLQKITIRVVGDSPLITHKFSQKSKIAMAEKQGGEAKSKKKDPRVPEDDYKGSMYWIGKNGEEIKCGKDPEKHKYGFGMPSVAFKAASVAACRNIDNIPMTLARGAFHILGEFVKIQGCKPQMRTDTVTIGMGTTDLRYRGEFKGWYADLDIQFNAGVLSAEQIVNLINIGGFACGVGEWRPSSKSGGSYGMYHVA